MTAWVTAMESVHLSIYTVLWRVLLHTGSCVCGCGLSPGVPGSLQLHWAGSGPLWWDLLCASRLAPRGRRRLLCRVPMRARWWGGPCAHVALCRCRLLCLQHVTPPGQGEEGVRDRRKREGKQLQCREKSLIINQQQQQPRAPGQRGGSD